MFLEKEKSIILKLVKHYENEMQLFLYNKDFDRFDTANIYYQIQLKRLSNISNK